MKTRYVAAVGKEESIPAKVKLYLLEDGKGGVDLFTGENYVVLSIRPNEDGRLELVRYRSLPKETGFALVGDGFIKDATHE